MADGFEMPLAPSRAGLSPAEANLTLRSMRINFRTYSGNQQAEPGHGCGALQRSSQRE